MVILPRFLRYILQYVITLKGIGCLLRTEIIPLSLDLTGELLSGDFNKVLKSHNALGKFIYRLLKRNRWSVREQLNSPSVPPNWTRFTRADALRIRNFFKSKDMYHAIAVDEMFL